MSELSKSANRVIRLAELHRQMVGRRKGCKMTTEDKLRIKDILEKSSQALLGRLYDPNIAFSRECLVKSTLLDAIIIGVEITLKHVGEYGKNTHSYSLTQATLENLMEMRSNLTK